MLFVRWNAGPAVPFAALAAARGVTSTQRRTPDRSRHADYGWFITDTGGNAKIQLGGGRHQPETCPLRTRGAWYSTVLGGGDSYNYNGKEYPRDLLDGLMQQSRIYALASSQAYAYQALPAQACR